MSLSRRELLKSAVGASSLIALSPAVPNLLRRAAVAATDQRRRDTVLVVMQLSGGNDGLNTIVPYADDAYAGARRTLRLTAADVHKIDDYLGFHPEMAGFARLHKQGRLTVIQGVGYPESDRNHPGAMRDWHTARPGEEQCPTGWLGRTIDRMSLPNEPAVPGTCVAPIQQPFALRAERAIVPTIRSARDCVFRPMSGSPAGQTHGDRLLQVAEPERAGDDHPLMDFVRRSTLNACATSRRIEAVIADAGSTADYPPLELARSLRTIAQLIRADVGIRIFFTELGGGGIGGFDNHANQRDNHAALLKQLSDSLAAFADDLAGDGQLDRVALMTFSEFGRTLTENGRRGTGHGAAQPVFVVSGRVRGELVGKHPSLTDLDQGAPKSHTDFRRVYATMLDAWLGVESRPVLGEEHATLDLFTA
jgi:uncharacterized protein (DUF1501 family)